LQVVVNIYNLITPIQKLMLASLLLAYFAPLGFMIITLGIQRIVKFSKDKKSEVGEGDDLSKTTGKSVRETWNPRDPML
jgi:hypothetical protein